MQSAYERMPRVPGMQHNLLRDYPRTEPVSARYTDTVEEHAVSGGNARRHGVRPLPAVGGAI